ncbi:MAG: gliding motility-associated C-terminal domain-containing protein [Crocinitomicaceae bacterium]|nr:gliding motility-associated C-terminal domain-containing protein [Crocinitomicaceae bacterium]
MTAGSASTNPTVCIGTPLSSSITISTTGATGIGTSTGLPAGLIIGFSGNATSGIITISGTPTTSSLTPYNYSIPLTGGCGTVNATGTITVNPNMTAGSASTNPSVCIGTPLSSSITISTTGATGIGTATGLPAGLNAIFSGNATSGIITISGTPTTSSLTPYSYSIPLTGGCGIVNATGTITVNPSMTAGSASTNPSVCIGSSLSSSITISTTGATGIGTATDLPAGLSINFTGNATFGTITISGTPTTSSLTPYNYSIPLTGGCGTVNATGTITVNPSMTAGSASTNPSVCIGTPLTSSITISTTGATGIGTAIGLPAGLNAIFTGNSTSGIITISGTPTTSSLTPYNYSIPLTGGCGTVNATGTITVNPSMTASSVSTNPSACVGTPLSPNIIISTTGATGIGAATGLPTGLIVNFTGNATFGTITISGTPTTSSLTPYNYSIPLTGGCGTVNATGTITVNQSMTVGSASTNPIVCVGTPLSTNITISTTGATGIGTATDLPAGLNAIFSGNVTSGIITISGTPTTSSLTPYSYSIPLTGGCGTANATGTITVNPNMTAGSASTNPTVCVGTPLSSSITISTTGATGIGAATGLPAGLIVNFSGNVTSGIITISGTPTTSSLTPYNYSIPLTGGCVTANATGTITVNPSMTVGSASTNPTVCVGTSVSPNITISTTGATGIGTAVGLPAGLIVNFTGNATFGTITISGTPTTSSLTPYNYSIPLTGGCGTVKATGTITVNSKPIIQPITGNTNLCIGGTSTLSSATIAGTWSSASPLVATIDALGNVNALSAGTSVISYSLTLGGCTTTNTTSVKVNALPVVADITGSNNVCIGNTSKLASLTTGGSWVSSNIGVATIDAQGLVTGVSAGTSLISYTVTANGCSTSKSFLITVNAFPLVAAITGTNTVCVGSTSQLSNNTIGGAWSSATVGVATVNAFGLVTGVSAGTSIISYTLTQNSCPTVVNYTVTVNSALIVSSITGTTDVCLGSNSQLTNSTNGGSWSSSNPAVASVNSSGLVSSISVGSTTISYNVLSNGVCPQFSSVIFTVNAIPTVDDIVNVSACNGDMFSQINFTGTGNPIFSWSNSNISIGLPALGVGSIQSFQATGTIVGGPSKTAVIQVTPNSNGCIGKMKQFFMTVNPLDNPGFNYSNSSYCLSDANPTPLVSGQLGGTFSSSPLGLSLIGSTGVINLSSSTPGYYSVKYTTNGTCRNDSIVNISVASSPTVASVLDQTVCQGTAFKTINFFGAPGTSFSWTNSDGSIGLATSGNGNISAFSASGTVIGGPSKSATIIVTPIAGSCIGVKDTFSLRVNSLDDATFTYPSNSFCSTLDSDPIAKITGKTGGVFNVLPVGTTYNATTGFIDLSASASGVYTLTYQTNGQCPNTFSASIAIGDIAFVNPIVSQEVCLGTAFNPINFTGSTGTSFDWTANNTSVGIAFSGSGNIPSFIGVGPSALNPTVSTTVTVTPKLGSCKGDSQTFKLTVNDKDNVNIAYSDASYCLSNTNPTPVITGQLGGDFSATPVGLIIDSSTGLIDIKASSQGLYTVMYKTSGSCADTSIASVAINSSPSVNNISDQVKCAGRSFVNINFSGTLGSTYDWTNNNSTIGLASAGKGDINAFVSTNSSNVIQTSTIIVTPRSGACIGTPKSFNLTVNPVDNASFTYSSSNICLSNTTISPTITGTPGGVFTCNLSSLSINNSGVINVGNSSPGTYNVTYTTPGVCNDIVSQLITINPLPIVDPILPQSVCEGSSFSPLNLAGGTLSTVYNWTNSNPSIGLGVSGVGSISSFIGKGTTQGGSPNTAVITVTPSIGSCIGASKTAILTVNSIDNPSFSYTDNSFCLNQTNPTPLVSGKVGGTFSVTPLTGLSINSVTGTIDLSSSKAGSYFVKYTTNGFCKKDSSVTISVGSSPTVNAISSQVVCQSSNFSPINFTGTPGTTFDWINTNILIGLKSSGSGNIVSFKADGTVIGGSSQISNITVTPRIGNCFGSPETFTLTTNPLDNADFSYSNSSYCKNQLNPIPTIKGLSGGTFSSTPIGLSLTSAGVINLLLSTDGYYDVSYTTHGQCPNVSTFAVSIGLVPSVNVVQSQSVCLGTDFQSIQFQGNLGTIFNWTNSNTSIGLSSSGTGDIPSFTSQAVGSSIIIVTPVIGNCPGTPRSFDLTVNSVQSSTINYGQSSYCTGDADPTPIVTGPLNGNFTSTPAGLQINSLTGKIDVAKSSAGTYSVFYNLIGVCSSSPSTTISIGTGPTVNSIQPISVCNGSQVNPVLFTGSLGTQFSWSNSNNTIGLSASGNGNIVSFTATNTSGSNKTATITVTPKTGTCIGVSKSFTITVYPSDNASFGYKNSNYCINSSDEIPNITGTSGGTFSFSPSGLNMDQTTGKINISNSTPATYNITYITPGVCPKAATQTIVINPMPSASAIVPQNACQGSLFDAVNITGTANTTFNWLNNNTSIGLTANGNSVIPAFIASGTIKNGSNNTAKITITPQINGCLGQEIDVSYSVNSIDDATFSYSKKSFCQEDPNPIAQITGTKNGKFSATPLGLDLTSTTGQIKIGTSIIGSYNVKYSTLGLCPVDTTIEIVINPLVTVNPVSSLEKCKGDLFPSVQFSGSVGSTFTWTNTNTSIGLLASGSGDIGSFTANGTSFGGTPIIGNITVTPQINGCLGTSTSFTYKVNPIGNPAFAYADNSFCLTQPDPSPLISGTQGGKFSSSPLGLILNQSSGQITLFTSKPGIYQITYTTPGTCPDDSTVSIGIGSNPSVNDIDDQSLCDGDAFDKVAFTGNPGTIFEWSNNNVSVGLPLSGTNDIASFIAKGTVAGGTDQVSMITVVPRIGNCIGTARSYKYKVRAKPNIKATLQNSVSVDTSFCKGGNATIVATGAYKNEYYTWTPNNLLVGNQLTGSTVITSTDSTQRYIVRGQSQFGCYNFDTVTINVYNPKVLSLSDTTVCAGTSFNKITFKGNVPTPYFEWTNSNPTIGLTFNGIGDIIPFIGVNNSSQTKQTALISVTPKYTIPSNGMTCIGVQTKFFLNVIKRDDASFSGYLSQYCANEIANTKPTILGAIGGEFSVRPITGLALNSLTGQIFPSSSLSGNYTVKYSTKGTCPKSDSIDLFINPLITATISGSDTVCINDVSPNVVFKGMNGVAPYTFTYKINNGTSQTITTNVGEDVVTLPIPTSVAGVFNVSLVSIRESSALVCSNNTLNANVTIKVNPLPSAQIIGTTSVCEGGAQPEILLTGLNGTAPFTFNYVINGVIQNPIQTSVGNVNAKLFAPTNVAGIFNYSIVGVTDASCSTIQPLNPSAAITIKPLPSATIKSSSSSICMKGIAEVEFEGINGLAPFTFTYKVNNGNNQIVKSTGVNSKVKITVPTDKVDKLIYSLVSVQDASQTSCTNNSIVGKDSIQIIPGATIKQLIDTTVCVGSKTNPIVFSGTPGATYKWTTNNTTIGISGTGINTIPSFTGLNSSNSLSNSAIITVSPNIGVCSGETMQFTISVRPLPRPQVKPVAPICPGDSILLEGIGLYNYVWTPDNSLSCFNCNPVKAKPLKTTNYKIYATDVYGCSDTTDFDVVVFDPPVVNGNDITICGSPDTIQLVGTGASTYTWNNGVLNGQPFVPANGVTKYVVTGTDIRGCKNTDTVTVTVLPKPIPLFSANTTSGLASYVKPLNILLTNTSSQADKYEWNFRNGETLLSKTTEEPVTALYRLPGKYVITLTAFNGICVDSASIEIKVEKLDTPSVLIAPNVFSPNNDGVNDEFYLTVKNAKTLKLVIYNRWGNPIHEISETSPSWDGKINGANADEGVYYYEYEIEGSDGEKVPGQGFIQLIRN